MTDREKRVLLRTVNRAAEAGSGLAYPSVIRLVMREPPSPLVVRLLLNELAKDGYLRIRQGSMQRVAYVVTDAGRAFLVGQAPEARAA